MDGLYVGLLFFLYIGSGSLVSSSCPDFSKKPPPPVHTLTTCQSDSDCISDHECCSYQGNKYCIREKDDDDDDDDDDKGCKGGKDCHGEHSIGKIILLACAIIATVAIIIGICACVVKQCSAPKRRIGDSLVDMRLPKARKNSVQKLMVCPMNTTTPTVHEGKRLAKEREAQDTWARSVVAKPSQLPLDPPPRYSSAARPPRYTSAAPPLYTKTPPPSYHI